MIITIITEMSLAAVTRAVTTESTPVRTHMMATALRNGEKKEHVLYFGPMGCRTGFYLLTEGLTYREAREAVLLAIVACLGMDEVPGSHREECGNYLEHDLAGAKTELTRYLALLHGQSEDEIALEAGLAAEAGA